MENKIKFRLTWGQARKDGTVVERAETFDTRLGRDKAYKYVCLKLDCAWAKCDEYNPRDHDYGCQ